MKRAHLLFAPPLASALLCTALLGGWKLSSRAIGEDGGTPKGEASQLKLDGTTSFRLVDLERECGPVQRVKGRGISWLPIRTR